MASKAKNKIEAMTPAKFAKSSSEKKAEKKIEKNVVAKKKGK